MHKNRHYRILNNNTIKHHENYGRKRNYNSFGIIIPMFCVLIIAGSFIYQKAIEKQYTKDGDCTYKTADVSPRFSLHFFSSIEYDEIKLDNKSIFKKNKDGESIQMQHIFLTGKKRIELFYNNKSIIVDSVCLRDDCDLYWLNILKDSKENYFYFQMEPVTYD